MSGDAATRHDSVAVDFPPNCHRCGWQLHPPVVWLVIAAALAASSAAGVARVMPVVEAELARSRRAYPQESPAEDSQEGSA